MTDDVAKLPVKFKTPPTGERVLELVSRYGEECNHAFFIANGQIKHVTYIVDEAAAEVECSNCKTRLNPMWVLARLAGKESSYHELAQRYQDEMRRLSERSRTKCENCGHMTRVSNR
jgi:ribosomal protein S27E